MLVAVNGEGANGPRSRLYGVNSAGLRGALNGAVNAGLTPPATAVEPALELATGVAELTATGAAELRFALIEIGGGGV